MVNLNDFAVEVTQYMTPNGRPVLQSTKLPIDSLAAYKDMKKSGCCFEAEMLRTRQVSLTISNGEEDVDIEIAANGPGIQQAMVAMLNRRQWIRVTVEDLS